MSTPVAAIRAGRGRALGLGALVAVAVLSAAAAVLLSPKDDALEEALSERGRVVVVGVGVPQALDGSTLVPVARLPEIAAALEGKDPERLVAALDEAKTSVLVLAARPASRPGSAEGMKLRGQLERYVSVDGLRGLFLSSTHAVYGREPTHSLSEAHRQALAVVARGLLAGKAPPRLSSFPAPLREVRPVEVMVLLRRGLRPRLWRSARGSSLARALLTAAVVARKRWTEREQAMGSPLDRVLPELDIDVALLQDDGTIGERAPQFIDRVFGPEHGVGYELKGAWRYLLPDDTHEYGNGRASRAFEKLFAEDGLPEGSLTRQELRLYRLRVRTLATSPREPGPSDGLGEVDPDALLEVDAGAGR